MTTAIIFKGGSGEITGFCVQGHASSHKVRGGDIYCAAISAITQTACIGLEEVIGATLETAVSDGYLKCIVKSNTESSQPVLKTMLSGLRSFQNENPGYLEIIEEVQQ